MPQRKPSGRPGTRRGGHAWLWWLLLLVVLGCVAYFVVLPRLPLDLRKRFGAADDSAAVVASLRRICSANVSFQYGHPKQGYARTLKQLGPEDGNYIDAALASGSKSGYRYEYVAKPVAGGLLDQYRVSARPQDHGSSFYMDDNCEIHSTIADRAATSADPVVK